MNDFSTKVAAEADEGSEGSSSDEGSSPSRPETPGRQRNSIWARAVRILKPNQASSLREDLTDALKEDAAASDVFTPDERAMLNNILRFREVRVEDVMVPRADIEAVDQNVSIGELMTIFEVSGRSRMPVYSETLDDPRGMVHIRDLLSYVTKEARAKRRTGNGSAHIAADTSAKAEKPARGTRADFDLGRVDLSRTVAEAGIERTIPA